VRAAIGEILPLAIAAGVSPFPIIGVVLMLATARGRSNGFAFLGGWLVGLSIVGVIGLSLAGATGASDQGSQSSGADGFQIVLGLALLFLAVRQWRKRPKPGEPPAMPKWMDAVEHFTAPRAASLGVVLSAVNPKNLLLTFAAATTIGATGIPGGDQALAFFVYVVIATMGVATPIVISLIMGGRSSVVLADLKEWLVQHNAAIMTLLLLVIGAKVLGQGISG
jgi:hypothetical protein